MSEVEINKYKNGKIYKILNTETDDIYVGSTCMELNDRMQYHITAQPIKQGRKLYKLMRSIGSDLFYIELLEHYPCETKEELRKREGHHIRLTGTLNMCIAGRTKQEWKEECREQILMQSKDYYERTKEHKQEHQKSDKAKEWKKTKNDCPCGGHYINSAKAEHFKSQKHKEYEDSLVNSNFSIDKSKELKQKKKESKEARKQQQKEYREKNKDVLAEKSKEYQSENKATINEYKKEWYEKNRQELIEKSKQYNEEHREEKNEYYRERYQKKKSELSIKTECSCGGCYTVMSKNKHFKTKVHQSYEESTREA